jgi:hypothetical protein
MDSFLLVLQLWRWPLLESPFSRQFWCEPLENGSVNLSRETPTHCVLYKLYLSLLFY